jgi:hypothetical protein
MAIGLKKTKVRDYVRLVVLNVVDLKPFAFISGYALCFCFLASYLGYA